MAKMIPSGVPEAFHRENYDGERLVWHALQKQLDDEYAVLWSVSTIGEDHRRELDYLVLHPSFGMVVVEVKGGIVEVGNPHQSKVRWTVHTRSNRRTDTINNPFDQAVGGSMAFIKNWKARSPFQGRYSVSQMVVLPHTPRTQTSVDNLQDLADRFVFANDLSELGRLVADRMARSITEKPGLEPLGDDGVKSIVDLYGAQHNCPASSAAIPFGPVHAQQTPPTITLPALSPVPKPPSGPKWLMPALGGLLAIALAIGAWAWWRYPFAAAERIEMPATTPAKSVSAKKAAAERLAPIQRRDPPAPARRDKEPLCKPYIEPTGQGTARSGLACRDASGKWIIMD